MRELWSRRDQSDVKAFLEALRAGRLTAALFRFEKASAADVQRDETRLEAWAGRVAERLSGSRSLRAQAEVLGEVLGGELGFAGDEENYYDPRNCLLGAVLERRRGMPILLSVVWMEAGRRAGLEVQGVGLPGHFIVRVGGDRGVLADPFAGGVPIAVEDCKRRVEALAVGRVQWRDEYLRSWGPPSIAERILRNLIGCFARTPDEAGRFRALSFLAALRPDEPEHLAARADSADAMGVPELARRIRREILERFPGSAHAQEASERMAVPEVPPVVN